MDPTSRSRARLVRAGRHAAAFLIPALLAIGAVGQAADIVWVGNDAFNNSNFSASGNWQNNTLPTWSSSNSLIFTQNQNANVTGLVYDLSGFQPVNDIFWASTFPVARTLSASDTSNRGIDFRVRLENLSSHTQTVTLNTSGGKFAAPEIQFNPVKASLILSGTIYNDNSVDYMVYGSDTGSVTNLTLNTALGPNAASQANVDFTVAGGRTSAIQVNASQVWAGTTTVNSGVFTTGSGVTLASTAIVVGGGTFATTSANAIADTATVTVNSGRFSIGGNETVGSLAGGAAVALGSSTLTVGGVNTNTNFSGSFTGSGGLTKVGNGTLTLSGSSAMTGPVNVSAGTVQVSGNGVVGGSTAGLGSGTVSIAQGAQVTWWLDTGAGNTIANPFVLSGGTLHSEDGANMFAGPITLAGGTSSITGRYNDFVSVSGGLSGTGSVVFGQQGNSGGANAPTFQLSGTATMTGTVRVTGSAGGAATTLRLLSQDALKTATLDMAAGDAGTVDFLNGDRDLGGLMGSRDISPSIAFLTVGGNGQSTEYSGRITMGASYRFTKTGTGSLLLSGSNGSLAGEVRVNGGRLEIGPTGSINATSQVIVGNGAEFRVNSATPFSQPLSVSPGGMLSGTGTIATTVFLSSTATIISPGNSPGILTFGTSQSWSGYTYVWELNNYTTGTTAGVNFDQIAITGGLTLTGTSYAIDITSLTAGNLPGDVGNFSDVARSWTILTTTGGITGFDASEWSLLSNDFTTGSAFTQTWSLTQVGNDLVLVAVPEPSTWALAVAGLAGGFLLNRRRRGRRVAGSGTTT
jgi:autotransporter-associated beta strand protein